MSPLTGNLLGGMLHHLVYVHSEAYGSDLNKQKTKIVSKFATRRDFDAARRIFVINECVIAKLNCNRKIPSQ